MGVTIPVPQKESEERPRGVTSTELSWSMQMDAEHPLSDPDELDLGLGASGDNLVEFPDSGDEPISLPSEEDEDLIMEQFTLTQATRPGSATASSGSPTPPAAQSLHEVCRRAAAKLGIEWPEAPAEAAKSRYKGRRLPKIKTSEKQLFPPVEPLVASHLHPSQRKVPVSKVPSQFPPRPVPNGQAAYRNSKRPTQPQPQSSAPPELKGAWTRRPFAPRAKTGPQQGQPASHGAKKKKRDS
uniref:Uncharacterized protein n=1 Tax=Knipowitschia caucasica TaxID=637954 RepID=A0AAV2JT54_KNICA